LSSGTRRRGQQANQQHPEQRPQSGEQFPRAAKG
jgi:hypothetical protein